jgi:hypothetical protein
MLFRDACRGYVSLISFAILGTALLNLADLDVNLDYPCIRAFSRYRAKASSSVGRRTPLSLFKAL